VEMQEYIRQVGTWQKLAQSSDIISLLSEIQLDTSNLTLAMVPALKAAAAAAAGGDLGSMDVLSVAIASANIKSNYAGEVAGMKRIFGGSLGGLMLADGHHSGKPSLQLGLNGTGSTGKINGEVSLHSILTSRFMQHIQQFVTDAQCGLSIDGDKFREACLQATALLLSDKDKYKDGVPEITSQLLRLLCWCPAHIFTPGAMETGVFVWTWLLAASPQLGPLVLAELVDAWLWTITSRRGLFADGAENSGPAAFLCPQLVAGESKPPPEQDPTESIAVHRVWLGFLLDRFEVVRHTGSDQLLLLVRLMQASMQSPNHFSSHPAAAGAFFTLLLLGLKLCDCLLQSSTHTERLGVNLLRDRVYR
jgi:phosphatidylinositol 4-kinase